MLLSLSLAVLSVALLLGHCLGPVACSAGLLNAGPFPVVSVIWLSVASLPELPISSMATKRSSVLHLPLLGIL